MQTTKEFRRRRIVELKHGRVSMLVNRKHYHVLRAVCFFSFLMCKHAQMGALGLVHDCKEQGMHRLHYPAVRSLSRSSVSTDDVARSDSSFAQKSFAKL